jgi:predicted ABC-type ATPase
MRTQGFPGCCQAQVIYGFGHSQYDGANRNGRATVEEFERELAEKEAQTNYYSVRLLTLNNEQYVQFGPSLTKMGWQLVNIADSLGHPTVVFVYVKNSTQVTKERIEQRLANAGIDIETIPVQKKRNLKKLKKAVDKPVVEE